MFDRFWRGEAGSSSGTGLGLYIAKGIIEGHGGRLWVESVLGRGATFHFTLPRLDLNSVGAARPSVDSEAPRPSVA